MKKLEKFSEKKERRKLSLRASRRIPIPGKEDSEEKRPMPKKKVGKQRDTEKQAFVGHEIGKTKGERGKLTQ